MRCVVAFLLWDFFPLEDEGEAGVGRGDVEAESPVGFDAGLLEEVSMSAVPSAVATTTAVAAATVGRGGIAVGRHEPDASTYKGSTSDGADDAYGLDSIADSLSHLLPLLEIGVFGGSVHIACLLADAVEHAAKQPYRGPAEHGQTAGDDAEDAPTLAGGVLLFTKLIIDQEVGFRHGDSIDAIEAAGLVVGEVELES